MDGQTPGKRLHRIRVVREGGYSVTFGVSAVRNLIRMHRHAAGASSTSSAWGACCSRSAAGGSAISWRERSSCARTCGAPHAESPTRRRRRRRHAALQTQLSEDEYVVLARFVERWSDARAAAPCRAGAAARDAVRRRARPTTDAPPGPRLLELHERERRARAGGRRLARRDGRGPRAPGAHRGGQPALDRVRDAARAGAEEGPALARRERRARVRRRVSRAVGRPGAAAHRGGWPRAGRAVLPRPARRRRAQPALPRPRHAAARARCATSSPRRPREVRRSAAPDRARRAAAVRAGDDRRRRRGAAPGARAEAAAARR